MPLETNLAICSIARTGLLYMPHNTKSSSRFWHHPLPKYNQIAYIREQQSITMSKRIY